MISLVNTEYVVLSCVSSLTGSIAIEQRIYNERTDKIIYQGVIPDNTCYPVLLVNLEDLVQRF